MNTNIYSAECLHGICHICTYEDCACKCHFHKSKREPDQMSHDWVGQKRGGDPSDAGSYEWVRYCSLCGIEDTSEDPLPPCG